MDMMEDVIALAPVAIAIAMVLIILVSSFVSFVAKGEELQMHRTALNIARQKVLNNNTIISTADLNNASFMSMQGGEFNFSLGAIDLDSNTSYPSGWSTASIALQNYSTVVSVPFVIGISSTDTHVGRFYCAVKRK